MNGHTVAKRERMETADCFAAAAGRSISDEEFQSFQKLIHREAGIYLAEHKKALLVGRLNKRLRELGLDSFGDYYRRVSKKENGGELVHMLDCICTNETQFFREPQHFEFLEDQVFPQWEALARSGRREKRIRAWSAACSTGEEAYSLAMTLLQRFPPSTGWSIEILASDLSTRALDRARRAVWPIEKSKDIPDYHRKRFMLKGKRAQQGVMAAGPEIRSVVKFLRLNLNEPSYPLSGDFDLIFCRNVLIYFDAELKIHVVNRLLSHLATQGYLFVGHSESLIGTSDRVRRVIPTVCTLA
jgi:chemotaxis protein methyltransferase CheR